MTRKGSRRDAQQSDGQFTIERLAHDCLDVRELRRRGFLTDRRGRDWPVDKVAEDRSNDNRAISHTAQFLASSDNAICSRLMDQGSSRRRAALDALPALRDARCKALRGAGRLLLPRLHR